MELRHVFGQAESFQDKAKRLSRVRAQRESFKKKR